MIVQLRKTAKLTVNIIVDLGVNFSVFLIAKHFRLALQMVFAMKTIYSIYSKGFGHHRRYDDHSLWFFERMWSSLPL